MQYRTVAWLCKKPDRVCKGEVWSFLCRFTGKPCRKLHLIDGRFIHRLALQRGRYSTQKESKNWRQMSKLYGSYFKQDGYDEDVYSKHFKKYYNDNPTKRYVKIMEQINKANRYLLKTLSR